MRQATTDRHLRIKRLQDYQLKIQTQRSTITANAEAVSPGWNTKSVCVYDDQEIDLDLTPQSAETSKIGDQSQIKVEQVVKTARHSVLIQTKQTRRDFKNDCKESQSPIVAGGKQFFDQQSPIKVPNLRLIECQGPTQTKAFGKAFEVRTRVVRNGLAFFDYEETLEEPESVSRSLSGSRRRVEQSNQTSLRLSGTNLHACIVKSWIEQKSFESAIKIPKVVKAQHPSQSSPPSSIQVYQMRSRVEKRRKKNANKQNKENQPEGKD